MLGGGGAAGGCCQGLILWRPVLRTDCTAMLASPGCGRTRYALLRSNSCRKSDHEARVSFGTRAARAHCASRRHRNRPCQQPPAARTRCARSTRGRGAARIAGAALDLGDATRRVHGQGLCAPVPARLCGAEKRSGAGPLACRRTRELQHLTCGSCLSGAKRSEFCRRAGSASIAGESARSADRHSEAPAQGRTGLGRPRHLNAWNMRRISRRLPAPASA